MGAAILLFFLAAIALGLTGFVVFLRPYIKPPDSSYTPAHPPLPVNRLSEAEIVASPEFQESLHELVNAEIWMALAVGGEGMIRCPIPLKASSDYVIILTKNGYDLPLTNLHAYYSSCAAGAYDPRTLEQFAIDLFGEYAAAAKKLISLDYITDHLISLEFPDRSMSDFKLAYEVYVSCPPAWMYNGDIRDLYLAKERKLYSEEMAKILHPEGKEA